MNLRQLVKHEILYHKASFALGLISVIVAAGILVAQFTMIDAHDIMTQRIISAKQESTEELMRLLEDDYRKIMKDLGFNLLILPEGQQLDNFYSDGYASKYMPEEYVTKLSESGIMTIRHLLPSLEQKIRWPEQGNRTILLVGTRGEVPVIHLDPKEPMLVAVPKGKIVLGYELWSSLELQIGDTVKLLGNDFEIDRCHSQRGNKDDITAWIDLSKAQEMFNREGEINAILALKCMCAGQDLSLVRRDVGKILPDTRVIEFENMALTRYKARLRAKAASDSALVAEKEYRAKLRHERESFASWLLPLVILSSSAFIGLLAYNNVRERRPEIGILRALGFRARQILSIFLMKAFLLGFLGAIPGYFIGMAIGLLSADSALGTLIADGIIRPELPLLVLIASPLLSSIASWVPALIAAREDPADILREE